MFYCKCEGKLQNEIFLKHPHLFSFILEHILEYCYSEAEMLQSKQNFRYKKPDIITFRLTGDEYDR